jgi:hypothetical protein
MIKTSAWNVICILLIVFGAIKINYTLIALGILLFIVGIILKFFLKVDDRNDFHRN